MDFIYKAYCYWRIHGTSAFKQAVIRKLRRRIQGADDLVIQRDSVFENLQTDNRVIDVAQIMGARFPATTPLRTYTLPKPHTRRVNLVTDSINGGSLYGGVGTALIFSALLANRLNAPLRIITRTERAKPDNVYQLLSLYKIELHSEIQFRFAAFYDPKYEIDFSNADLFITTSWWTTAATLPSVSNDKIIYLLQEDERMFYPFGDDRFKCDAILKNKDIRFLINSQLLYKHFDREGLNNITTHGLWFEPAFPADVYYPREKVKADKLKFFFYARPNNPRNLFYLGIEVIERAINEKILDTDLWDIYLVGKDIPSVTFEGGYTPIRCQNLSWAEYAELAGTIDLGLSLMYTPHPSYPPLDLVASGAVVITNKFTPKEDLTNYSSNLLCAELDSDSLVRAIKQGASLVSDSSARHVNYANRGLCNDWRQAFSEVIQTFAGHS